MSDDTFTFELLVSKFNLARLLKRGIGSIIFVANARP